jgi:hypothetical protein
VILGLAYSAALAVGFSPLETRQHPIGDPMFFLMKMRIMVMMSPMIALTVAAHAGAPISAKTLGIMSVVFMGLLANASAAAAPIVQVAIRKARVISEAAR